MKSGLIAFFITALIAFSAVGVLAEEEPAAPENKAEDALNAAAEKVTQGLTEAGKGIAQGDLTAALPLLENYIWPVAQALLILLVAYFVGKFLGRLIRSPIQEHLDRTLGIFVGKLMFYAVMLFALLGVLGKFGISVASFAAVVAAAGFAIGLAFQGTLSNFAAGVLLLVFRPYKVGDVINAAGITAKVVEIELFNTVFDTFDNRRIIVPNSQVGGGTIENISHHSERRVEVPVGVDYRADIEKTREVLSAAAESLKDLMVEGEGRGYLVILDGLGDSAVNWNILFWTKASDFLAAKQGLIAAVKNHLDRAGIGIPFPQMGVHLDKGE